MVEIKRLPWSDSGGLLCLHYLDAYKQIKGEWALLQILSNLLKRGGNSLLCESATFLVDILSRGNRKG